MISSLSSCRQIQQRRGSTWSRGRLKWDTYEASVEVWGCGWGWCAASSDFVGQSWENSGKFSSSPQILGVICREFRENLGFLHHRAASFAGAPITPREQRHVTQPRARINVSCSRAGQKGAKGGGAGEPREGGEKDRAGQGGRGTP